VFTRNGRAVSVMIERPAHRPDGPLISVAAAAMKLGVDVATLLRWYSRRRGPAATAGRTGSLAYRVRDLEAWQDRFGEGPSAN
jgi:hypothetical protein